MQKLFPWILTDKITIHTLRYQQFNASHPYKTGLIWFTLTQFPYHKNIQKKAAL